MESYRRVLAPLACKRCHVETRFEVTFKTGPAGLETLEVGQTVPPEEELASGESFRGSAGRYCTKCFKEWQRGECSSRYKHMADAVRDGRLAIRRAGSADTLTTDDLLELGRQAIEDVFEGHGAPPPPTQDWVAYEFTWEGEDAVPGNRAHQACNAFLDEKVEAELVRGGWRWGRNALRHNLRVYLDADARIRVEVVKSPNSCPVCTLEPAFEEPYDQCPRCGWYNDPLQRNHPEAFGSNLMTLQQALAAWRDGKPVK